MKALALGLCVAALGAAGAVAETAPADVVHDEYGAVEQSLTGVPGDPEGGVKVMSSRGLGNCVACHQVAALPDVPFQGEVGPALDGVGDRWTEADLRGIVVNAKAVFPDTVMPSFYRSSGYIRPGDGFTGKAAPDPDNLPPLLTAQQVEDVVAYLLTLKDG